MLSIRLAERRIERRLNRGIHRLTSGRNLLLVPSLTSSLRCLSEHEDVTVTVMGNATVCREHLADRVDMVEPHELLRRATAPGFAGDMLLVSFADQCVEPRYASLGIETPEGVMHIPVTEMLLAKHCGFRLWDTAESTQFHQLDASSSDEEAIRFICRHFEACSQFEGRWLVGALQPWRSASFRLAFADFCIRTLKSSVMDFLLSGDSKSVGDAQVLAAMTLIYEGGQVGGKPGRDCNAASHY